MHRGTSLGRRKNELHENCLGCRGLLGLILPLLFLKLLFYSDLFSDGMRKPILIKRETMKASWSSQMTGIINKFRSKKFAFREGSSLALLCCGNQLGNKTYNVVKFSLVGNIKFWDAGNTELLFVVIKFPNLYCKTYHVYVFTFVTYKECFKSL